jgi:signal transduction histidine kinase
MGKAPKSASRLTLIFITAFVISGAALSYFSIRSISNLKELTEKKVLEEQGRIFNNIMNGITQSLAELTLEFNQQIHRTGFIPDSLEILHSRFPYFAFPFKYDKQGDFAYPFYIKTLSGINKEENPVPYCNFFSQGELSEFSDKQLSSARNYYKKCLSYSRNAADSAKVFNALGRIAIKRKDHADAYKNYGIILTRFPNLPDASGYPYSNYGISQLIRINDTVYKDMLLSHVSGWLINIINQEIPLMQNTGPLVLNVKKWISTAPLGAHLKVSRVQKNTGIIMNWLDYLLRFGTFINNQFAEANHNQHYTEINGYRFIEINEGERNYLLSLDREKDQKTGFIIDIKEFLESIVSGPMAGKLDFDYNIELHKSTVSDLPGNNGQFFDLRPLIASYVVQINLHDEDLIAEYISTRKWVYGIFLTLLLFGMLFAISLILRDIRRERQLAALRSEFVSNVTHELKSPITSIRMFAESMFLGRVSNKSSTREYYEIIIRESERLKRMINNILEFSGMENQQEDYRFEEAHLSPVLNEVLTEMSYWCDEKKITLTSELDENIHANIDREKIKQVIGNLISNAIKFTPENKNIYVRLFGNGKHNFIEVSDEGIGIPDDQLNQIFKKFYRVNDDETAGISGTGLGLTVVKEIVDAHGWGIKVESNKGKGSRFTLIF